MSVAVTQGIKISVESRYREEESDPKMGQWVWSYEVTIENQSASAVRLLSRHWVIKDSNGNIEEVRGDGVIGQTPFLEAGERFVYQSWCPLPTDWGSMRGTYQMQREGGEHFEAAIAPFALMISAMLN